MKKRRVIVQHKADQNLRVIHQMEQHIKDLRRQLADQKKINPNTPAGLKRRMITFTAAVAPDATPQAIAAAGVDNPMEAKAQAFRLAAPLSQRRVDLQMKLGRDPTEQEMKRLMKETGVTPEIARLAYGPEADRILGVGVEAPKPLPKKNADGTDLNPLENTPFQQKWRGGGTPRVASMRGTMQDFPNLNEDKGLTPASDAQYARKSTVLMKALLGQPITEEEQAEFGDELMTTDEKKAKARGAGRAERATLNETRSERKWREFNDATDRSVAARRATGELPPALNSMYAVKMQVRAALRHLGRASGYEAALSGGAAKHMRQSAGLIVASNRRENPDETSGPRRQDRGGWLRSRTGSLKRKTSSGAWEYKKP